MAVNRYRGTCAECRGPVPANAGSLSRENGSWVVRHLACDEAGQGEVITYYSLVTGFMGTRNRRGLCEDAPCCGCCTM